MTREEFELEQDQRQEIRNKLINEIEWYYEREGEMIELEQLEERVRDEMQQEGWTFEGIEFMEEIALDIHDQEAQIIIDIMNHTNAYDTQAGKSFFDRI